MADSCDSHKRPEVKIFLCNVDNLGNPVGEWHNIKPSEDIDKELSLTVRFKITDEMPEGNKKLIRELGLALN